jgi:uncharacterized SAM-binding protein YcdF (DUF218 family)
VSDAGPALDAELIAAIEREHLIDTPLREADLLFVFGTRHGIDAFADVVADLWSKRLARLVIVSGGMTWNEERSEADVLSEAIQSRGVPEESILLETRATNTGENVIFSLPIIEERIGLDKIRSVIAVGKYYTSSRYLMTLQRHWPEPEKMFAPVHLHELSGLRWHEHPELRAKVLREWAKLPQYRTLGYIADWP